MEFAGGMGMERFGAGDGKRADACYAIFRATRQADDPEVPVMPPRFFLGWLQAGFMGEPRETWLLEDAAGVGGWYLLELPSVFREEPDCPGDLLDYREIGLLRC